MTDPVKCRWPACEDKTDCMNGCKPAPQPEPLRRDDAERHCSCRPHNSDIAPDPCAHRQALSECQRKASLRHLVDLVWQHATEGAGGYPSTTTRDKLIEKYISDVGAVTVFVAAAEVPPQPASVAQGAVPCGAPVAFTNEAQIGFLEHPNYVGIPMAMWAKPSASHPIALYASPAQSSWQPDQVSEDDLARVLYEAANDSASFPWEKQCSTEQLTYKTLAEDALRKFSIRHRSQVPSTGGGTAA